MSYEKVMQLRSRVIIGTKQTLKSMRNGEVSEVFVADDADQQITRQVERLAMELDIPCERVDSMKKLGAACGIEVGASALAIKRSLF
ncbi:ribosomal L7Ae/L30e/S12e/Gadd45 family protein [Virgibacillus sp. NKC19-16]|uniref:ribosomal L7Ae/L30e/S12e/Gadd45 family protein n=1 Tax=Virgibacillus salidurans TaxID=2831673 RepID=UPI001F28E562|nr:ribosomal L7Ae/L30e/S12e/Gadd45 family protein [Virgibacillus sp. NKC19-16]UJL46538.1 ribosomal L7Ae/L30e/S12e/Gadd45 family protein [Virgibacillus sp. NKC19-16]